MDDQQAENSKKNAPTTVAKAKTCQQAELKKSESKSSIFANLVKKSETPKQPDASSAFNFSKYTSEAKDDPKTVEKNGETSSEPSIVQKNQIFEDSLHKIPLVNLFGLDDKGSKWEKICQSELIIIE